MPDHDWRCPLCREKNRPYTEVCWNCNVLASPESAIPEERSIINLNSVAIEEGSFEYTWENVIDRIERLPFRQRPIAYLLWGSTIGGLLTIEFSQIWWLCILGFAVADLASTALKKMMFPKICLPKRFVARKGSAVNER